MVKITGGRFKGCSILTPDGDSTRPTQAKIRQALFNSIQFQIPDSRVLDLFSGSGAIGFEALSRGATWADFYDSDTKAINALNANQKLLGVEDESHIYTKSIESLLRPPGASHETASLSPTRTQYDFIFADPPYGLGWEIKLLEGFPWKTLLKEGGMFILEWSDRVLELPETLGVLTKTREQEYGDSVLTHYKRDLG
ncbi:MAG: 16S rRNA (guanine(966)-N(2))-methyltransferase RsmD [Xanthomonadaceae bacterium]|nr:16S rRNA (guanine(966)-N(2))-methyltransferase RsmD [Xanthomonadaceae bacterium]